MERRGRGGRDEERKKEDGSGTSRRPGESHAHGYRDMPSTSGTSGYKSRPHYSPYASPGHGHHGHGHHGHGVKSPTSSSHTGLLRPDKPSDASSFQGRDFNAPSASSFVGKIPKRRVEKSDEQSDASGSSGHGSSRSGKTAVLRTRPEGTTKRGTTGVPVRMLSNYFPFLTKRDWCFYQYRVDFTPDDGRTMIRKALLRSHRDVLGAHMFDGTVLFTSHRLSDSPHIFISQRKDGTNVIVSCKLVGDVMRGNPQYIQFFNVMIRACISLLGLKMIKRDFYDPKGKINVSSCRAELWPGYTTSVRQHESEMLLCTEITHKFMRTDTCYDILKRLRSYPDYQARFVKAVVGSVVLTDYNNCTYRIDDVDFKSNPCSTFTQKDGTECSYLDYMRNKYQLTIRDPGQPMLISRTSGKAIKVGQAELVSLIPEVCRCTGIAEDVRNNMRLKRDMDIHTRMNPSQRVKALMTFIQRLTSEPKVRQKMAEWQMRLSDNLLTVPGRVLPREAIYFGTGGTVPPTYEWMSHRRENTFRKAVPLTDWVVIYPQRAAHDTEIFIGSLKESGQILAFPISQPEHITLPQDDTAAYIRALSERLNRCRPQLVLCVVLGNRSDLYSVIKKICCIDRGVQSQVVTTRIIGKGFPVAFKVAIQIGCKIGGFPWVVDNPIKGTMLVGFDVSRDLMRKEFSYGAMVATVDDSFGKYFSTVTPHQLGEELSNNLSVSIIQAVQRWQSHNKNALPDRIFIYRDGVGEGDLPYVYNHEVELIKSKLKSYYKEKPVKMTFIIVTKRLNTRLFLDGRNPTPGTVVDDVITCPERYDFFLASQAVTDGTVSPTSYNVISDSSGLNPDKIQRLSYKLCHMYFNWSGTVSVPAPVQYAHKLSFLVAQSLHRCFSSDIDTTLFYL